MKKSKIILTEEHAIQKLEKELETLDKGIQQMKEDAKYIVDNDK